VLFRDFLWVTDLVQHFCNKFQLCNISAGVLILQYGY
jgi:hypothetical protein